MDFEATCREHEACAKLAVLLNLPSIPGGDEMYSDDDHFDPWNLFPCFYGSYNSEFDDLAISVLEDMRDGTWKRRDLASEMLREVLCTSGLCDYGTSPRVCFASTKFAPMLPRLIDRWTEYAELKRTRHAKPKAD